MDGSPQLSLIDSSSGDENGGELMNSDAPEEVEESAEVEGGCADNYQLLIEQCEEKSRTGNSMVESVVTRAFKYSHDRFSSCLGISWHHLMFTAVHFFPIRSRTSDGRRIAGDSILAVSGYRGHHTERRVA